jgi:hypothetical protein
MLHAGKVGLRRKGEEVAGPDASVRERGVKDMLGDT